ncbi:MAG: twin-arginine translocase subunit TatB [Desulfobacteraceae bacterium]|nr:twin-arginine translocase subunit TatB [Desulfobacteraceae bacterium]
MFGLGMPEILLILAIALIVIGPKKLPDLAKTLGRAMGEFKRSAQDFKRSLDVETTIKDIKDVADPTTDLKDILKDANKEEDSTEPDAEFTRPVDTDEKVSGNDEDNTPVDTEPDGSDNISEKKKNDKK